jgi:c-di-GMP-binding flagellar brake protein YcgR
MKKKDINRRQHARLRIHRSIAVPIHIFPVLPFLGESVDATLLNISSGGMALVADFSKSKQKMPKGTKIKVHFRLPGQPLCECTAKITHNINVGGADAFLGISFVKAPPSLIKSITQMCRDNDRCDERIRTLPKPLCESACSFYSLCHKPLRRNDDDAEKSALEIAFQHFD